MSTLPAFEYHAGTPATLGARWQLFAEMFKIYVTAENLTDQGRIKAKLLLKMGTEAFAVYETKRKADKTDTIAEINEFMEAHFVTIYCSRARHERLEDCPETGKVCSNCQKLNHIKAVL